MIGNVLPLLRILLDIIRLRKGPDAIPHSPLLFVVITAMWLLVVLLSGVFDDNYNNVRFLRELVLSAAGLILYAMVVMAAGKGSRLLRALTAILGCGTVISVVLFTLAETLTVFLDEDQVRVLITVVWLWSVPVEGHIIARTIDQHWYIGLLLAIVVLLLQLQLLGFMGPLEVTTS